MGVVIIRHVACGTGSIDTIPHRYETNRKSNTKSHADVIPFLCLCAILLIIKDGCLFLNYYSNNK